MYKRHQPQTLQNARTRPDVNKKRLLRSRLTVAILEHALVFAVMRLLALLPPFSFPLETACSATFSLLFLVTSRTWPLLPLRQVESVRSQAQINLCFLVIYHIENDRRDGRKGGHVSPTGALAH